MIYFYKELKQITEIYNPDFYYRFSLLSQSG